MQRHQFVYRNPALLCDPALCVYGRDGGKGRGVGERWVTWVAAAAQGDMIPWVVGQQFQDADFPRLSGARIVRIAVHPNLTRGGCVQLRPTTCNDQFPLDCNGHVPTEHQRRGQLAAMVLSVRLSTYLCCHRCSHCLRSQHAGGHTSSHLCMA